MSLDTIDIGILTLMIGVAIIGAGGVITVIGMLINLAR